MRINPKAVRTLVAIVRDFRAVSRPYFTPYQYWESLDNGKIWWHFLCQVIVVGRSSPSQELEDFSLPGKPLSYRSLCDQRKSSRVRTIHRLFRRHGVRFAGRDATTCRKTAAVCWNLERLVDAGGPRKYLSDLCRLPEVARPSRIAEDFRYIKLKGSRDLSATLGLAKDVIALDSRLLTILRLAGVAIPKAVQSDRDAYNSLQEALLSQVCSAAGVTGVQFDRILYRNSDDIKDILK